MDGHPGHLISSFPEKFRVFLPPGTTDATVMIYMAPNAKEFIITRYNKNPDGQYFDWTKNVDYSDVPIDNEGTMNGNLALMNQRDMFFPNRQGSAFPLSMHVKPPTTQNE